MSRGHWIRPLRSHRGRVFVGCLLLCMSLLFRSPPLTTMQPRGGFVPTTIQYRTQGSLDIVDHETKFILYYTTYWNQPTFQFGTGRQPFLDYNCPVNNCWAQSVKETSNRNASSSDAIMDGQSPPPMIRNLSLFDAVLFSVQAHDRFDLKDKGRRSEISSWRRPNQRFVFFMMESQSFLISNLRAMDGFFNWTMTFRWDSDIPRPYGWFEEIRNRPEDHDLFSYPSKPKKWIPYNESQFRASLGSRPKSFLNLARRPGKVAWIVSHCDTASHREDYVQQLRQYIPVDEFGGKCLDRNSPTCDQRYSITSATVDNCTTHVQQHYKFYLAFENQFCNDYVTEKFFQRMEHSVVITLGQANYSEIAPPHSSISIFDFDSAADLAKYLLALDKDDASYLSYFWWKDFYRVHHPRSSRKHGDGSLQNNFGRSMCRLCEKLHDPNEPPYSVYQDMGQWWRESAECGKLVHGVTARMMRDPGLPGFRPAVGSNNVGDLAMFVRKHADAEAPFRKAPISRGENRSIL